MTIVIGQREFYCEAVSELVVSLHASDKRVGGTKVSPTFEKYLSCSPASKPVGLALDPR